VRARILALVAAAFLLTAADDPKDYLKDPKQEARAKALFEEIRCVVCQNETVAASEAPIAQDVRKLVRQQVAAGKTNGEIKDYLRARWGDFVLLKPRFTARTAVLWILPFAIVGVGGVLILFRRKPGEGPDAAAETELTASELKALKQLQNKTGVSGPA
jgi:cytochrome c-type biogenesis protein CcmH